MLKYFNRVRNFSFPILSKEKGACVNNTEKMNSAIKEYMGMVYTIVILAIAGACMCAGVTFSLLKFYPTVPWTALGIFVLTYVLYFTTGCILIKKAYIIDAATGKKVIQPEMLHNGKLFVTVILVIQFNFISYMIPSKDFLAFTFFFVITSAVKCRNIFTKNKFSYARRTFNSVVELRPENPRQQLEI